MRKAKKRILLFVSFLVVLSSLLAFSVYELASIKEPTSYQESWTAIPAVGTATIGNMSFDVAFVLYLDRGYIIAGDVVNCTVIANTPADAGNLTLKILVENGWYSIPGTTGAFPVPKISNTTWLDANVVKFASPVDTRISAIVSDNGSGTSVTVPLSPEIHVESATTIAQIQANNENLDIAYKGAIAAVIVSIISIVATVVIAVYDLFIINRISTEKTAIYKSAGGARDLRKIRGR